MWGSGLVTLGIEKGKAKCEMCRLSWLDTESTTLRLLYAVPIVEDKRVTSFITAPFVRSTLSFSKSSLMHEACLRLFLHRYNHHIALMLN